MAIAPADILFKLSTKSGSAGNSLAQGDPSLSLGKYVSTTTMAAGANSLFDDITGLDNSTSTIDYRCIFVLNNHATLTLMSAVIYLSAQVSGGASVTIALDNIAASAKGATAAQAASATNEGTAPTGVGAYSAPTTRAAGLALGNIGPGQVKAVWVKRTAADTAALNADGVTFAVVGDTAA